MIFKGGTSLSKGFGLIERFSEDIDLVVRRAGLGFDGERDPTIASSALSNRKRDALSEELRAACSHYVLRDLAAELGELIGQVDRGCDVRPDEGDTDGQTLLIEYPTLYPSDDVRLCDSTHQG